MRSLIRYAKTPRYPCNTQSPQLGFNELDVQFSRSKRGPERIASVHAALERSEAAGLYYGSERKILKQVSLIDAIRVGRVREQRLAIDELEKRIVAL